MKLLMIYTNSFSYRTTAKTLDEFPEKDESISVNDYLVCFIHAEEHDQDDLSRTVTKLIKNIKWAAGKNSSKNIVLHSFAHLSESKADPTITMEIFNRAEERLLNAGYSAIQTPFGYFLDLNIEAPGYSQARIFKSF